MKNKPKKLKATRVDVKVVQEFYDHFNLHSRRSKRMFSIFNKTRFSQTSLKRFIKSMMIDFQLNNKIITGGPIGKQLKKIGDSYE